MDKDEPVEQTRLLVVIVNYMSCKLVSELVGELSIQKLPTNVAMSIICADNSCSDYEASSLRAALAQHSSITKVTVNDENLGFGSAVNTSLTTLCNAATSESSFDFLLCINPDVTLHSDTIFQLLVHAETHANQGIWGGITVDDNIEPDYRHAWQEPTLLNTAAWAIGLKKIVSAACFQDNYRHIRNQHQVPYPVDSVSGCLLLISQNAWHSIGQFDSDYFLYSEEIDLCRKARSLGFQPTVVPSAILQHAHHSKSEFIKRLEPLFSSKLMYAEKHHGLMYNILYRTSIVIGAMLRIFNALATRNSNEIKAWSKIFLISFTNRKTSTQR